MPTAKTQGLPHDRQAELQMLDPAELRFSRRGATLRLTIADRQCFLRVAVVRAFPYSAADRYLSILDSSDREIGLIAEPDQLDRESRELIAADIERRYRLPHIDRVIRVRERFGTQEWTVATDYGTTRFTTRHLYDNARVNLDGYIILTDVDGNRFRLPPLEQLDAPSRQLLDSHL